jgi:hypothetical protein
MASKAIAPRADYLGYGLGAIMAFVLAFVVLSAGEKNQDRRPVNEAIFARSVLFSDRLDGGISIRDASTGQMIGEILAWKALFGWLLCRVELSFWKTR